MTGKVEDWKQRGEAAGTDERNSHGESGQKIPAGSSLERIEPRRTRRRSLCAGGTQRHREDNRDQDPDEYIRADKRARRGARSRVSTDRRISLHVDWICIGKPGIAGLDECPSVPRLLAAVLSVVGSGAGRTVSKSIRSAARTQARPSVSRDENEGCSSEFSGLSPEADRAR